MNIEKFKELLKTSSQDNLICFSKEDSQVILNYILTKMEIKPQISTFYNLSLDALSFDIETFYTNYSNEYILYFTFQFENTFFGSVIRRTLKLPKTFFD